MLKTILLCMHTFFYFIIFVFTMLYNGSNTIGRLKLKLADRCSNNQAELLAIHKALEMIKTLNKECYYPYIAIIYTDSRVAIDSIHNTNNHSYLAEETRKMLAKLAKREWNIKFSWVKARAGNPGNETADRIAKEAARNADMKCDFDRIPKSTIYREAEVGLPYVLIFPDMSSFSRLKLLSGRNL